MDYIREWKRRRFPKGIRREVQKAYDRVFRRATEKKLARAFAKLQIPPGAVICVHSMLSGLGYLVGGPETVIRAIQKAVPECTIFMPTFPFSESMKEYVDSNPPPFDVNKTPSKSGLLTETFRLMPGVKRSCHPTHPCAALGPRADELLDDSELCQTPFGDLSSYGRFCNSKEAFLLLIHTNNASIVHRVQEMVGMPNLFMDEEKIVTTVDNNMTLKRCKLKIHRPQVPLYVVVPPFKCKETNYLWFPNFGFLFPKFNRERILNEVSISSKEYLLELENFFISNGVYRSANVMSSQILAVRVSDWLEKINADVELSVENYPELYAIETIKQHLEKK